MQGWIERPILPPFACPLTLRDAESDGPYYATGIEYFRAHPGANGIPLPGRVVEHLVLAPQAIREMAGAQGSPIVVLDAAEYARQVAGAEYIATEREELTSRVAELEAENATLRGHLNPQQLAEAIAPLLDERYARKTGRKPAGTAA